MAKFEYSFQRLLDWQVDLENQSKTRISNFLREAQRLQSYLVSLEAAQKDFFEKMAQMAERTQWLEFEKMHVQKYRQERKTTFDRLQENEDHLDGERLVLKRIIQKRQMLEEIKNKKNREFQQKENKKQQKILDELVNRNSDLEE